MEHHLLRGYLLDASYRFHWGYGRLDHTKWIISKHPSRTRQQAQP